MSTGRYGVPPLFRDRRAARLFRAYPNEVIYQLKLAYEYVYHVGVHPKGGLDNDIGPVPPLPRNTKSSGTARPGTNVSKAIDAISSVGVRLWASRLGATPGSVDPTYGQPAEPGSTFPDPPTEILGYVRFNQRSDEMNMPEEFGLQYTSEATMTVPRLGFLVRGQDPPKVGDLVEFWGDSWETLGTFYDVKRVAPNGRVNSSNHYVQWVLELRRRDEFLPERRLLGC